jgi:hypothetical protein
VHNAPPARSRRCSRNPAGTCIRQRKSA